MDRREFLVRAGRAALGSLSLTALAAACTSAAGSRPPTGPSTVGISNESAPGSGPPPSEAGPPTSADWAAFGASLDGSLVRPASSRYATAHELFDPRFDSIHPAGIALCASEADVQRSIAFVSKHGLDVAARAGGHSYAGYSTGRGLVCDVSALLRVRVDPAAGWAVVGSGARLVDIYAAAAAKGVAIPGGSCPTVGISGLALGGGQGVIGRKFGLTSDNVTSLRIVTAEGAILTCYRNRNADLFWACRGGGGGNFGVVTSFAFRVHPLTHLARFFLSWPWSKAADVVTAWQGWAPHAPDELWSNCHLRFAVGAPAISVSGVYVGSQSALQSLIAELQAKVGTPAFTTDVSTETFLDTMFLEAGCSGLTVDECHLPSQNPHGKLEREEQVARSDFFDTPLPPAGIAELIASVEGRGQDPLLAGGGGGLGLDAFGGAINRVPAAATAFVHRNELFLAQYTTHWSPGSSPQVIRANHRWLDGLHAAMAPYASGFAYQNYIDPTLADWQHAYYGGNFARLVRVKAKYDPDNVFHFAQSIPVH